jgi:hypothetical protein
LPIEILAHGQSNKLPQVVFDRRVPIKLLEVVAHSGMV